MTGNVTKIAKTKLWLKDVRETAFGVEELKDGSLGRILQKYLKKSFFVINLIEIYVQLQVISIKSIF